MLLQAISGLSGGSSGWTAMAASGCGLPGLKRVILTTRSAPEIVTHIYSVLTSRHAIFSTRSFHEVREPPPSRDNRRFRLTVFSRIHVIIRCIAFVMRLRQPPCEAV